MKPLNRTALFAAAFALVLGHTITPAQAAEVPAFNISVAGGTLSSSTLSGFGEDQQISLSLTVPSGRMTFDTNASTATLISSSNTAASLLIQGTQSQLLTAFSAISLTSGCDGGLQISATVDAGGGIKNVFNNHYYRLIKTSVSFDEAITLSEQTTFDGTPSGSPGYLATITSAEENDFLFTVMGGAGNNAWIAASDSVVEGDWKWMTGPEAGTSFYTGNVFETPFGPVNGQFSGWAPGEPNQSGDEDYAEVYGDGRWNDIPSGGGQNYYLIEWGGMPGDNFNTAISLSDTDSLAGQSPFSAGDGTALAPYQLSDASQLSKVGECSGPGIHFKQTADFNLTGIPVTPIGTGQKPFEGVYDGNNKKIEGVSVDGSYLGLFGRVGNYDSSTRNVIKNLSISGQINMEDDYYAGLVSSQAYNSDFINLTLAIEATASDYSSYFGGIAGFTENVTISSSSVSGTIEANNRSRRIGGFVGRGYNTDFTDVTSTVTITGDDADQIGGIGGQVYNGSSLTGAKFTGSIAVTNGYATGGLVGSLGGSSIEKSYVTGTVSGREQTGGLVGEGYDNTISKSYSSGAVTGTGFATGGLVGNLDDSSITESFTTGAVNGSDQTGGLVGRLNYSTVTDSYSNGAVNGSNEVGALFGYSYEVIIARVYSVSAVTSTGTNRGLFGSDTSNATTIESSFWTPELVGVTEANVTPIGTEMAISVADAKNVATYQTATWSIGSNVVVLSNTWTICEDVNSGFPFLSFAFPTACLDLQVLKPVPTISGSGFANSPLKAVPGTWDSGTSLTFTWYVNGVEVVGNNSSTFTPRAGDIGAVISVKVTSTKAGFLTESTSSVRNITAKAPVVKPVKPIAKSSEIVFSGMTGNSWWMTNEMKLGVRKAVKANAGKNTLVCTGIVKAYGSKAWMKTVGLKRAEAGCWYATLQNTKLKVTYKYVIAAPNAKVQRGFSLNFSK